MGIVDRQELLTTLEDKEFCLAITGVLLSVLSETLETIALGMASRDDSIIEHLHALKGNVSYFYARESTELIDLLMSQVKMHQWDLALRTHTDFVSNMEKLKVELHELENDWRSNEQ